MDEKQTKEMIDHLLTELKKYVDVTDERVTLALQSHGRALSNVEGKVRKAVRTYELELRDTMAAAALQGFCGGMVSNPKAIITSKEIANVAYEVADTMLAAREGKEFIPVQTLVGPCPECRANADPLVNGWCNKCRLYWHIGSREYPIEEVETTD